METQLSQTIASGDGTTTEGEEGEAKVVGVVRVGLLQGIKLLLGISMIERRLMGLRSEYE